MRTASIVPSAILLSVHGGSIEVGKIQYKPFKANTHENERHFAEIFALTQQSAFFRSENDRIFRDNRRFFAVRANRRSLAD